MQAKYPLIVNVLLGLAIALTPLVVFPVCSQLKSDGSPMGCYYSGILITILGIIIVLSSLTAILSSRFVMSSLSVSAISALLCWLIPNRIIPVSGISLCGNLEHACRAITMPKVGIFVALVIVVSFAGAIVNFVTHR